MCLETIFINKSTLEKQMMSADAGTLSSVLICNREMGSLVISKTKNRIITQKYRDRDH